MCLLKYVVTLAVSSSENFRLLGVLFTSRVSLSGGVGVSPLALLLSGLFLPVPLSSWFSGLCLLIPLSSGSWLSLLLSYSFGSVLSSSFSFLSLLGCPDCAHSFSTCVFSSVSLPNRGCPLLLSSSVGFVLGSSFSFLSLLGCPDCAHSLLTGCLLILLSSRSWLVFALLLFSLFSLPPSSSRLSLSVHSLPPSINECLNGFVGCY